MKRKQRLHEKKVQKRERQKSHRVYKDLCSDVFYPFRGLVCDAFENYRKMHGLPKSRFNTWVRVLDGYWLKDFIYQR